MSFQNGELLLIYLSQKVFSHKTFFSKNYDITIPLKISLSKILFKNYIPDKENPQTDGNDRQETNEPIGLEEQNGTADEEHVAVNGFQSIHQG